MELEEKHNTKPAYIEQVLMWMVIFIGFVWMFFFVIEYATAIRIKDNIDALSEYSARKVSGTVTQTGIDTDTTFIASLNNIRMNKITLLTTTNLTCVIDNATLNSQVIFITQGTFLDGFLSNQGTNNFISRKVVFNESNSEQITCTLNVTIN